MEPSANHDWKAVRLLVFDLDGTLIDSALDLALSVNAMRKEMARGPLPVDLIASYVGHGAKRLVERALEENATGENVELGLKFFLAYYREHSLDNTKPYPGVTEALAQLNHCKMAVLSNKPVKLSQQILERLGLAPYFAYIYGGNSFEQKKPDPIGVHTLMQDLQATAQQTLMIGDSDTDVRTGQNAGVWTCGVTYGFGAPTLQNVSPDLVIADLRELPPLLDGHGR